MVGERISTLPAVSLPDVFASGLPYTPVDDLVGVPVGSHDGVDSKLLLQESRLLRAADKGSNLKGACARVAKQMVQDGAPDVA